MKYIYGGKSDKGFSRTKNEDFIQGVELDEENVLCIIADGAGSHEGELQPGQIVCNEIELMIRRLFEQDKRVFLNNVELIMKESILWQTGFLEALKWEMRSALEALLQVFLWFWQMKMDI